MKKFFIGIMVVIAIMTMGLNKAFASETQAIDGVRTEHLDDAEEVMENFSVLFGNDDISERYTLLSQRITGINIFGKFGYRWSISMYNRDEDIIETESIWLAPDKLPQYAKGLAEQVDNL